MLREGFVAQQGSITTAKQGNTDELFYDLRETRLSSETLQLCWACADTWLIFLIRFECLVCI